MSYDPVWLETIKRWRNTEKHLHAVVHMVSSLLFSNESKAVKLTETKIFLKIGNPNPEKCISAPLCASVYNQELNDEVLRVYFLFTYCGWFYSSTGLSKFEGRVLQWPRHSRATLAGSFVKRVGWMLTAVNWNFQPFHQRMSCRLATVSPKQ